MTCSTRSFAGCPDSPAPPSTLQCPVSSPGTLPIIFLENPVPKCPRVLIYFHGNSEDAAGSEHFIYGIADELDCHAVMAEYPGYGVYANETPNQTVIYRNALELYDFLVQVLKFRPENIYLLGRSLGSGPSTYLAAQRKVGLLILFSAYKSIQEVAVDHAWIFGRLITQCFKNEEWISKVIDPVFMVHGQKDEVVKVDHSVELFARCTAKYKKLIQPKEMTHNRFNSLADFIHPLKQFLHEIEEAENRALQVKGRRRTVFEPLPKTEHEHADFAFPLLFLLEKFKKRHEGNKSKS